MHCFLSKACPITMYRYYAQHARSSGEHCSNARLLQQQYACCSLPMPRFQKVFHGTMRIRRTVTSYTTRYTLVPPLEPTHAPVVLLAPGPAQRAATRPPRAHAQRAHQRHAQHAGPSCGDLLPHALDPVTLLRETLVSRKK